MTSLSDAPDDTFEAVVDDLSDGFGVEDIAVRRGVPPDDVRSLIADLRRDGMLEQVIGEGADA